jgi:hypothetical protein
MMKSIRKDEELKEILQSIFRCTKSLILSSALSAAVLSNTYEHIKGVFKETDDKALLQEKDEAVSLMQFQLVKIYDIRRRCVFIEQALRQMAPTNRPLKKLTRKRRRGAPQSHFIDNSVSSFDLHFRCNVNFRLLNPFVASPGASSRHKLSLRGTQSNCLVSFQHRGIRWV